jgi:hypothetical protein
MRNKDETIVLLIDGAAGIYIPRNFYEHFDFSSWSLNVSEFGDLSDPDKDLYWDAWDDCIHDAKHIDTDGHEWTLYQDDDLFAVRNDHEWSET